MVIGKKSKEVVHLEAVHLEAVHQEAIHLQVKMILKVILQKEHRNLPMKQRTQQIRLSKMLIPVKDLKKMLMLLKTLLKKPKMLLIELKMLPIKVIRKGRLKLLKKQKMLPIELKN